jgi:hypothetical protein
MASGSVDYANITDTNGNQALYRFPLDLTSETQGHYMIITAYPSQSKLSNNTNKSPISIALFIPGGGQNSTLMWQMAHIYDEVKLTRLGTSLIGAIPGVSTLVGAAAGAGRIAGQGIINPKVDVLYSNSNLRRFQFDYFMAPASKEEQAEMQGIIKTLRRLSSPEVTVNATSDIQNWAQQNLTPTMAEQFKTGFWFVPPAEFEIKFRFISNGQQLENPNLPKIARCVLTNVDVNYTQQGEYSTFQDGAPTSAQLTLAFEEMRVISQQDVDQGY